MSELQIARPVWIAAEVVKLRQPISLADALFTPVAEPMGVMR